MTTVSILYLEDNPDDAELAKIALAHYDQACHWRVVKSGAEYLAALDQGGFDLVLSDNQVPGIDGRGALEACRARWPTVPFVFLSGGALVPRQAVANIQAGATDQLTKDELWRLVPIVQRAREHLQRAALAPQSVARDRLITVIQALITARTLERIIELVSQAARALSGADGAAFILRDGDQCYYAGEDAAGPLWKGQRFPLSASVSGWAMLNRQPAVIPDIYADERVPVDRYRATFVKSLAMVPIRASVPIGALGIYWAETHRATPGEVMLLQALADTTSVAIENVQVYQDLEQRVRDRTARLEAAHKELEAYAYAVSHDLRAPLRAVDGFSQILFEEAGANLNAAGQDALQRIHTAARRAVLLADDLLRLSRVTRADLQLGRVDLSQMAHAIAAELRAGAPARAVEFNIAPDLIARGDSGLLRLLLDNLLGNAWKYTSKRPAARIDVGRALQPDGTVAYHVRDNGVGFDMAYAGRLFGPFQRLHGADEFPGTGIGLATAQRIVHQHGGQIWVEAAPNHGAAFYFTLLVFDQA